MNQNPYFKESTSSIYRSASSSTYSQSYSYPPVRRRSAATVKKNIYFMKLVYIFIAVFLIFVVTAFYNEKSKAARLNRLAMDDPESRAAAQNLVSAGENKVEGETLGANWSFNIFGQAEQPQESPTPAPIVNDEKLVQLITAKIPTDNGKYSVVVKPLGGATGASAAINADEVLPAASLYKLYLMAATYQEIEKGSIKEDTVLSSRVGRLEQILGGEEFGYADYDSNDTVNYSVDRALKRVAEISDNYAAILLAEKISWDVVRKYASDIGATHTTIKSPISTSASDIANFLDLLYQKKIVSPQSSDKIIEYLSGSKLNNRIPDQLPESLKIAHKTGELAGVRHDAGIVFLEQNISDEKSCTRLKKEGMDCSCVTDKQSMTSGDDKQSMTSGDDKEIPTNSKYQCKNKGPYLIVLMSNEVKGEDTAIDTLSDISKVVFDYYNKAD